MDKQYFHFALGPVQSFVAQARRTRDFWAGSFLLSWLTAIAMREVLAQGGEIIVPLVDQDFLNWLEDKGHGEIPNFGCVPNCFEAKFEKVVVPEKIDKAIRLAWEGLANIVYREDIQPQATAETRIIWERQITNFWEITWVIAEKAASDRRKNFRTYRPSDEPGVKCMMMDNWQELSGLPAKGKPYPSGSELNTFWRPFVEKMETDFREGERLSALAFIKRRFAYYFDQIEIEMPSGWRLKQSNWKLVKHDNDEISVVNVPSIAYMAGIHWLRDILQKINQDKQLEMLWEDYFKAAEKLARQPERNTRINCLERLDIKRSWLSLDGQMFFRIELENPNNFPAPSIKGKQSRDRQAMTVARKLACLNQVAHIPAATPFYAILRMDGDNVGQLLQTVNNSPDGKKRFVTAIDDFTRLVPNLVREHDGFLVYAGGDDVLAVLPLDTALNCAIKLREAYQQAFANKGLENKSTLSGAVEYAHIKMPLTRVLKDAHDLLDNVAKAGCGRDAIAVRVWKPGGNAIEWAQPWAIALEQHEGETRLVLDRLADQLRSDDDQTGQFSSQFFYKIRERFELLNPEKKHDEAVLNNKEAVELMTAEYVSSSLCDQGFKGADKMQHAEAVINPLLKQCRPVYRDIEQFGTHSDDWPKQKNLYVDGALLVRFLAHKGVDQ